MIGLFCIICDLFRAFKWRFGGFLLNLKIISFLIGDFIFVEEKDEMNIHAYCSNKRENLMNGSKHNDESANDWEKILVFLWEINKM